MFNRLIMIVTVLIIGCLLLLLVVLLLVISRRNAPVSAEMAHQPATIDPVEKASGLYKNKASVIAFAHLAGWLIKKNSRDPKNRILFALDYFKANFDDAFHLEDELFRSLEYAIHIRSAASGVNKHMRRPLERKQLIDFLIDLAFVDGDINQREVVALARLCGLIGVQMKYLERVVSARRAQFNEGRSSVFDLLSNHPFKRKKALEVLGLPESATAGEIRKTYRKLVKTHHPDKFMNAPEEKRTKAAETFREIQEAYELLMS
jgi:DnaJ like chaperone protein